MLGQVNRVIPRSLRIPQPAFRIATKGKYAAFIVLTRLRLATPTRSAARYNRS